MGATLASSTEGKRRVKSGRVDREGREGGREGAHKAGTQHEHDGNTPGRMQAMWSGQNRPRALCLQAVRGRARRALVCTSGLPPSPPATAATATTGFILNVPAVRGGGAIRVVEARSHSSLVLCVVAHSPRRRRPLCRARMLTSLSIVVLVITRCVITTVHAPPGAWRTSLKSLLARYPD